MVKLISSFQHSSALTFLSFSLVWPCSLMSTSMRLAAAFAFGEPHLRLHQQTPHSLSASAAATAPLPQLGFVDFTIWRWRAPKPFVLMTL